MFVSDRRPLHPVRVVSVLGSCFLVSVVADLCLAAGGTSQVASAGGKAHIRSSWPLGVEQLLAHPSRGHGWNDWFSEWPSDVNHYELRITSTEELNELIDLFVKIELWREIDVTDALEPAGKSPTEKVRVPHQTFLQPPAPLEIRLCPTKQPKGFGWVSKFPENNNVAAVFSIGDQGQIDRWYQTFIARRGGQFGVMKFEAAPVAVPPTLTIFIENNAVQLLELKIPDTIDVKLGGLPGVWHKANTEQERQLNEKRDQEEIAVAVPQGSEPAEMQTSMGQIRAWILAREKRLKKQKDESDSVDD